VRYLGVPLISTTLCVADCASLLDQITSRIDSWLDKKLSFAGGLQLITSVIKSIQIFLIGIFILPKSIIRAIEQKSS
jgi:uncharacterized protein involved in cysteine biosynthesis